MKSHARKLLNSSKFTCRYCGNTRLSKHQKSIDHVVPKSSGGSNCSNNLVMSCTSCNWSKSSEMLSSWFPRQNFYNKERHRIILQKIGRFDLAKNII